MLVVYFLALATLISTLIGGMIILRFHRSLPYFFAFSAGSIIAVAFLDILPECLDIAGKAGVSVRTVMLIIVSSFFLYSLVEKYFATHSLEDHGEKVHAHVMGPIGAGSLVLHSFFDGVAIGIAFSVSVTAGLIIALAVIMHDMTDGINTVAVMLKNHQPRKKAIMFLVMGALAPVIGLILASMVVLPQKFLVYLLAFFVGEFLNIGAVTLLPETTHHPSKKIVIAMALGILLIAFLTALL